MYPLLEHKPNRGSWNKGKLRIKAAFKIARNLGYPRKIGTPRKDSRSSAL